MRDLQDPNKLSKRTGLKTILILFPGGVKLSKFPSWEGLGVGFNKNKLTKLDFRPT
jgi:hypothetical protein